MIFINQKTTIAFFGLMAAVMAAGDSPSRGLTSPPICGEARDCGQCAFWGCSWAAGQCLGSCSQIADVACFSGEGMCEKAREEEDDYALCGAQTDCGGCTSTSLSGGEGNCSWHPETQACQPLVCDAFSCGTETCLSPEEEICFLAGTSGGCTECLESGCDWTGGSCITSCDMMADTACYSPENFVGQSTEEICLVADTAQLDQTLCSVATSCDLCTETLQSDGESTCKWYADDFGESWCGTGDCDMFGNCGSDSCYLEEIPVPLPEEIPVPLPAEIIPVPLPQTTQAVQPCNAKSTCSSCLSQENSCAWVAGSCQESCNVIADAACYTLESAHGVSGAQICAWVEEEEVDAGLCSADNCQDCTSTLKSDGQTNCSWYTDGASNGWCGVGECDMNGNCGSSNPSKCPHGNVRGGAQKRNPLLNAFLP